MKEVLALRIRRSVILSRCVRRAECVQQCGELWYLYRGITVCLADRRIISVSLLTLRRDVSLTIRAMQGGQFHMS